MKTCARCKQEKPFDCFTRNKNNSDGLFSYCKDCRKADRQAHYARNRDRLIAENREWREANPEKYKAYHARYQSDPVNKARAKAYREANRERIAERQRTTRTYGGRDPEREWATAEVGYKTAHNRVAVTYGLASLHSCIDCGEQAKEWSYRGGSPVELIGEHTNESGTRMVAYSPDPRDYDPRCKSCHVKYDSRKLQNV